jgi:hypothetical protein
MRAHHERNLGFGESDFSRCRFHRTAGKGELLPNKTALTGLLNHSIDGIFEIIRVVRRHLVSIAEVHAIVARAHLAQGEPEMSRDRFGFLERHSAVHRWFRFLVDSPPVRDLLLCAKHLFVEAMVQKSAAVRQRRSGDGRRARPRWRHSRRAGEGIVLRLGGPLSGKPDIEPTSPNDRS